MKNEDNKILIVDDEPDMCWALEQILQKNGFFTRKALSAKDALSIIETNRFRLVFLDAKLPDVEGFELARQIREKNPSTTIVIISGYFYKDGLEVQAALQQGLISDFISKPFNNDEIKKVIASLKF